MGMRTEHDLLGSMEVPADSLAGIHTFRAVENFPLAGRPVHPALILAYGEVKLACAMTNRDLGCWAGDPPKADAIIRACQEMAEGLLSSHVIVDGLQGGAGTSLNMNVNEVLANRALQILGCPLADYGRVSPLDDVNLHQSTNDTFPTALRLASIRLFQRLEQAVLALQEAFQVKEKAFSHVVKVARTEMQDAVLTTLGREMGAYAEALTRDRWRIYKCQERLRVVNLGGTAVGTGLTAPRQFIFRATEQLRELTAIGLARAEDLVEATQNADVFVEVSGILKAHAANLLKISSDLRLLSMGPEAGIAEISLPSRQAGSSIMPGKVNPVIPEAVSQAAMLAIGYDASLTQACAAGSLDLNPFLPLVAVCLLESCDVLTHACDILRRFCVEGITANEDRCLRHVQGSMVLATVLVPVLGYTRVCELAGQASQQGKTLRQIVLDQGLLDEKALAALMSPEAVNRLGIP
jgi:aspartate ammonia-lyase